MIDPAGMDWYSHEETGALEWIDVTTNDDGSRNEYQEGYKWVGGADASVDEIRDGYSFVNPEASESLLEEVTVEPSITDKLAEGVSDALRDGANTITYLTTALTMPIINAIGGGDVSWAKVYTFDQNWDFPGQELDDGTLTDEQLKDNIHYTTNALLMPITPIRLSINGPLKKWGGEFVANQALKAPIKKGRDKIIGYKK